MNVKDRFLRYIKIDTKSDENSTTCPSTNIQFDLLKVLESELNELGLDSIEVDENGYLYAVLKGNTEKQVSTIGFIAHIDTAPSFNGTDVKPNIIENYDGKDIVLNKEKNIIMKTEDFPELLEYIGEEIITTDGTSLLGADDKAGISEIIEAIKYIIENKLEHGDIKIAFTPDEEIGRGANKFNVAKFDADYAYTMDGGEIGELEYENFNAASAKIQINGVDIHPGSAKDKMVNSLLIAMELEKMLPNSQKPEYTEEYEGFFHLINMNGNVEKTTLHYIIRDHDMNKFNEKKELMKNAVAYLNSKYATDTVELSLKDSYYNMEEKILPVFHIVKNAEKAMLEVGVTPKIVPIRGGTDGSRLSYMGLPTPNIFTGGHNFHGKFEYIPTNSMKKAVEVIVRIIKLSIH